MKKLLMLATTASLTLFAISTASAATTVTGVVDLTGTVPAQCSVVNGGTPPSGDFGATISVNVAGSIADPATGHLLTGLQGGTDALAGQAVFQINCTGGNNTATLKATPLALNPAVGVTPSGYASSVSYTGEVDFATTGSPVSITRTSDSTTSPASTGFRLANPGNNVAIKAHDFTTGANVATDILMAGSYLGEITVIITPGA